MAVNTFTGIPSIIVGIFVYITVVKTFGNFSAVAGGIALAIIMIPIIARTSEDVMRLVPGASQGRVGPRHSNLAGNAGCCRSGCPVGHYPRWGACGRPRGRRRPLPDPDGARQRVYASRSSSPPTNSPFASESTVSGPFEVWHQQAYGAAFVLVAGITVAALLLRLEFVGERHEGPIGSMDHKEHT